MVVAKNMEARGILIRDDLKLNDSSLGLGSGYSSARLKTYVSLERAHKSLKAPRKDITERTLPANEQSAFMSSLRVNKQLTDCTSLDQLLLHCDRLLPVFDFINISCAMQTIAKHTDDATPTRPISRHIRELWARMERRALSLHEPWLPQNISILMWALAKLQLEPGPRLLRAVLRRSAKAAPIFKPIDLSHVLRGLAVLGIDPGPDLLAAFTARVEDILHQLNSQDVANLMWALTTHAARSGAAVRLLPDGGPPGPGDPPDAASRR